MSRSLLLQRLRPLAHDPAAPQGQCGGLRVLAASAQKEGRLRPVSSVMGSSEELKATPAGKRGHRQEIYVIYVGTHTHGHTHTHTRSHIHTHTHAHEWGGGGGGGGAEPSGGDRKKGRPRAAETEGPAPNRWTLQCGHSFLRVSTMVAKQRCCVATSSVEGCSFSARRSSSAVRASLLLLSPLPPLGRQRGDKGESKKGFERTQSYRRRRAPRG